MTVIFEDIKRKYNKLNGITLSILLTEGTVYNDDDGIVLFQVSFDNYDDPICRGVILRDMVFKNEKETRVSAIINSEDLNEICMSEFDFYQICYYRKDGTLVGKSGTFQFSSEVSADKGSESVKASPVTSEKNSLIKFTENTYRSHISNYTDVICYIINEISLRADCQDTITPDNKFFSISSDAMRLHIQELFQKLDNIHRKAITDEKLKFEAELNNKFLNLSDKLMNEILNPLKKLTDRNDELALESQKNLLHISSIEKIFSEQTCIAKTMLTNIEKKVESIDSKVEIAAENSKKIDKIVKNTEELISKTNKYVSYLGDNVEDQSLDDDEGEDEMQLN